MDLQCSNLKIGLKVEDFVIWTSILPKIWPFLQISKPLQATYGMKSTFLVLFRLCNYYFGPFMDLQCTKWLIGLKIYDFFIFHLHFAQNLSLFAPF